MRIIGIDPGLQITGYGVLDSEDEQLQVIEAGVIRTDKKASIEMRLNEISSELKVLLDQTNPDAVAIEELYSHYGHPRTAIIMGHARGIIFLEAARAGLKVYPYASTRIKKSLTGNGRAPKRQMQLMIASTLGLAQPPEPPDVADALAVALCHCRAEAHDYAEFI